MLRGGAYSIDLIGNSSSAAFNHGERGGHEEELVEQKGPSLTRQSFPRVLRVLVASR